MWAPNEHGNSTAYSPHIVIDDHGTNLTNQTFYFKIAPEPSCAGYAPGAGPTFCSQTWGFKADFKVNRWQWWTSACARQPGAMAVHSWIVRLGGPFSPTHVHYQITVNKNCADSTYTWTKGEDVGYSHDGLVSNDNSDLSGGQLDWHQLAEVTSGYIAPGQGLPPPPPCPVVNASGTTTWMCPSRELTDYRSAQRRCEEQYGPSAGVAFEGDMHELIEHYIAQTQGWPTDHPYWTRIRQYVVELVYPGHWHYPNEGSYYYVCTIHHR